MELTLEIVKSIFWLIIVFIVLFDGSISEWLEAKANKIRAEAERIRESINDNRTDSLDD